LWSDLAAALRSANEDVVLGACGLLERAILAAYERAGSCPSMTPWMRRLIHLQRQELKCCYAYFMRRLPAWRKTTQTVPPAAVAAAA
jgi:hypothetical protein